MLRTETVDRFVEKNFLKIRNSRQFHGLSSSYLKQILESSFLKVRKESDVLESVLKWVAEDEERQKELPKLMGTVRLDHLEKEELWHIAEDEGVKKHKECQEAINEALKRNFFKGDNKDKDFKRLAMEAVRPRHSTSGLLMVAGGIDIGMHMF